jgi:hypothetical protein
MQEALGSISNTERRRVGRKEGREGEREEGKKGALRCSWEPRKEMFRVPGSGKERSQSICIVKILFEEKDEIG